MRYYPENELDFEDLKELNAQPWQVECLKLNPSYNSWGNFEDYMLQGKKLDSDWSKPSEFDSVEHGLWDLDDYNECVNFYFKLYRTTTPCVHCNMSGYNLATEKISDDWYDFADTGRKWQTNLTQDEVDALWELGKMRRFFTEKPTAEQVNEESRKYCNFHDVSSYFICVEIRAKREGVYGLCEHCNGNGYIYTEPKARLGLQLWILHPRKGCSKGIFIKDVKQEELPLVLQWLRGAAKRNAERFEKITNFYPWE